MSRGRAVVEIGNGEKCGVQIMSDVAEHPTSHPFRLGQLRPRIPAQRAGRTPLGLNSRLPLPQFNCRGVPADNLCSSCDTGVSGVRVLAIQMKHDPLEQIELFTLGECLHEVFYHHRIGPCEHKCPDPRIRDDSLDNFSGADVEVSNHCRGATLYVRLVPHGPVADLAFITDGHCLDPFVPCG